MSTVVGQTAGRRRPESRIGAAAAGVDAFSKTRTTRFFGLAVAVVVGLIGSLAIIATPAAAAVPGLIRVSSTSGYTPHDAKIMVVACPAGKQLVGTGARIDGGVGKVVITNLSPSGSPTVAPTSVTAQAEEIRPGLSQTGASPCTASARTRCQAWCGSQPRALTPSRSTSRSVSAVCPTGKKVVGTGFSIGRGVGEFGEVSIDAREVPRSGRGPGAHSCVRSRPRDHPE